MQNVLNINGFPKWALPKGAPEMARPYEIRNELPKKATKGHNVEKRKILSRHKNSDLFSKIVTFMRFLPKICEREFR